MVESPAVEAKLLPSDDHATLITASVCACNVCTHAPLRASHIRMVLSSEGEARYEPSGDHAMRPIYAVCPRRTWRRVKPGTGEPPISVKVVGRDSFFLREDLGVGAGFGWLGFRLFM